MVSLVVSSRGWARLTAKIASEFVIAHKTVSRKHLTISIDRVDDGAAVSVFFLGELCSYSLHKLSSSP